VPDDLDLALSQVSQVVVNTVGPAYAGQPFNPNGLTNMRKVRDMAAALDLDIEIAADGGVRAERLPDFIDAGCNHFICGTSSLFKPDSDLVANAADFKQALDTAINIS
jgi:ribulose-phosphate 3-epimerase